MQPCKSVRNSIALATGFWSTYIVGHWISAQTYAVSSSLGWLSYAGFSTLAFLVIGIIYACKPTARRSAFLDYSCAAFSSAVVLSLHIAPAASLPIAYPIICVSAAGVTRCWLLVRWGAAYARRDIRPTTIALLFGAVVVSLLKIAMAVLPEPIMFIIVACIPIGSIIALRKFETTESACLQQHQKEPRFSAKELESLWPTALSIVIFLFIWSYLNIVLKTGSGHYGFGDLSSPALTILAQLIDILFMVFLYWWLFVRKNGVEFNWLWRYAYVGLAAALLLIARLGISQPVQIFTSAAFEIALVFLWLALTDIARNSKFHPHAVFGFGYLLYTVPDWVARGMASTFAISSIDETSVSLCLFAIVLVVAFLLPHRAPGVQLLLADFTNNPPQDSHDAIRERCEKLAIQNNLSARETEVVYHLCYGRSNNTSQRRSTYRKIRYELIHSASIASWAFTIGRNCKGC